MPQNWDLDEKTGDYLMAGGSPVETDSLRVPAYMRLKIRREGWMYAPDNRYGSDFWTIKKRQTTGDASTLENAAARALQPIADDGRAASITIETTFSNRQSIGMDCQIITANGRNEELKLPSIGV